MIVEDKTSIDLFNPLQNLFADYKRDKEAVENVIAALDKNALDYFFSAAKVGNYRSSVDVGDVFKLEPAIKAIDAKYWQTAMHLTDVLEYMPTDKRNEWHDQVREHKTPEFTIDTVKATLTDMLLNRERFNAERVDGLFRALSGDHVTNRPQGFSKRMILAYMYSYGSISYERSGYIHDLRLVIAKLMDRGVTCNSFNTSRDLDAIARDGQWNDFDGGAFRVRCYQIGTIHFEIHPDIAWQLNKILAFLHPMAIPAEFRTKPKKKPKSHKLSHDLISFEILSDLDKLRKMNNANVLWWPEKILPKTEEILTYLGGVKKGNECHFNYDVDEVLKELRRTGAIPERKSHQYYPTPDHMAHDAVEWADIKETDDVLEPEAGQGGLAEKVRELARPSYLQCIEISQLHCEVLESKGFCNVLNQDFLAFQSSKKFDKIIMNPPFSDGRAVEHVRHAATMLKENGSIVAIMPASNKGKIIVDEFSHEWSGVYKNEFQGCSVDVVILKLRHLK